MDRRILEILANKPELIDSFPEWMLSFEMIKRLRDNEDLAIAEIAGRDSIAAAIKAVEIADINIKAILPTIAYTGTEFGNWEIPFRKTSMLKERLKARDVEVFDPVLLGSPKFWWRLCGMLTSHFFKKYTFYSHCVGCHLYIHAIRIPLAKEIACKMIIGGERESHDGRIKVNQIGVALDAYSAFLKKYGIDLLLPLRYVESGKEIEAIIGEQWDEGKEQLECVLGKNYQQIDGSVLFDEEAIKMFLYEFAMPEAGEMIKQFLSENKEENK
jgi:hypothetical protein